MRKVLFLLASLIFYSVLCFTSLQNIKHIEMKKGSIRTVKATGETAIITGLTREIYDSVEICAISGLPLQNNRTIYYLTSLETGSLLWNEVLNTNFFLAEHFDYTQEQKEMMWQADLDAHNAIIEEQNSFHLQ